MHLCIDVIKISSTTVSRKINSDWYIYELFINYVYIENLIYFYLLKKPIIYYF